MGKSLWDGHEYRASEQRADLLNALDDALVVVDTNVLLDLYRYVSSPREALLDALRSLGDRIFIPYQVSVEFWRGREGALSDSAIRRPKALDDLSAAQDSAVQVFNEWANRVALDEGTRRDAHAALANAFEQVTRTIEGLVGPERAMRVVDTSSDSILEEIIALCDGKVGVAPEAQVIETRTKEGMRRAAAGEPPGYKDKKKEPVRVVGDYLLWCEAMDAATERGADLILVTRDTKEDWWKIVSGEPVGPRIELLEEFWVKSSGKRAYFLRPSQFVSMVAEKAGQPTSETVGQLARAERSQTGGAWNSSTASELISVLREWYPPQYEALKYAAQHSGRIPREEIYELSGYQNGRTLRGFGRPVNRLARSIYDPTDAMEDFPPVFDSYYDPAVSWVQAAGFEVDGDLASAMREVLSTEDNPANDD